MRVPQVIIVACGLLALWLTCRVSAQPLLPQAPPDVQAFVRAAIADRFAAGDIPDLKVAVRDNQQSVAILAEMPTPGLRLSAAALPTGRTISFRLVSRAEAQTLANQTQEFVRFIAVDLIAFTSTEATLMMGGEFVMPNGPNNVKLCCCSRAARFVRTPGGWGFAAWSFQLSCA